MKNTKKYIICLFSFLAFFLISCEKNKDNKKEEEKVLVCSDITTEPECDKKSNCEWLDNVCKDKQSNDEENSENNEESLNDRDRSEENSENNEESLGNKSELEETIIKKDDESSLDNSEEKPELENKNKDDKGTLEKGKSASENKTDDKSNNSSADNSEEKSKVVTADFNPTQCSHYVGNTLEQCGMKNLTPTNAEAKDRIVCDIVNNKCENVKKCENIKVPKIEQGKNKGQIITTSPQAQRCRVQGCFVREAFFGKSTCNTTK